MSIKYLTLESRVNASTSKEKRHSWLASVQWGRKIGTWYGIPSELEALIDSLDDYLLVTFPVIHVEFCKKDQFYIME